jgi:hypothetical protein
LRKNSVVSRGVKSSFAVVGPDTLAIAVHEAVGHQLDDRPVERAEHARVRR